MSIFQIPSFADLFNSIFFLDLPTTTFTWAWEKVLSPGYLEGLVRLVNEDLDTDYSLLKGKMDTIDLELHDVKSRLGKLYEALETGTLTIDDLAPRIKDLKARQDGLQQKRVQTEADMVLEGVQHVDVDVVKSYAEDLRNLLGNSDLVQSKDFRRSFVKRITIEGGNVRVEYSLPMPPEVLNNQKEKVLPLDTLWWAILGSNQ